MVDFISNLIELLLNVIARIENLLSFVINLPIILFNLFISLPTFMQVGFSTLVMFFITFFVLKIYSMIH